MQLTIIANSGGYFLCLLPQRLAFMFLRLREMIEEALVKRHEHHTLRVKVSCKGDTHLLWKYVIEHLMVIVRKRRVQLVITLCARILCFSSNSIVFFLFNLLFFLQETPKAQTKMKEQNPKTIQLQVRHS